MTATNILLISFCIVTILFVGYYIMDALRIRRIKRFLKGYC